jgi:hypothetical protein
MMNLKFISANDVKKVLRFNDLIPQMECALKKFSSKQVEQPVRSVVNVKEANGYSHLFFRFMAWHLQPFQNNCNNCQKILSHGPLNKLVNIKTHLTMFKVESLSSLLTTELLGSPQSKFQISNYHLPYRKLVFFSINTYICALNQGAHTSFSKIIFWKQIRMSLVLEYN